MTYQKTIDWLFQQFPAYQHVGISAYKPDLDNVLALCKHFKVDYSKLKFIHVAGTNGKGSTSNYLASILQESGYKTGLFTSPHILDFRERIRVNGVMISEQKVMDFCAKIQDAKFDVKPSFFEITWILTLLHFIDEQCDICVIETGLGGRLDATNIIQPLLCIITSIGLDHTAILGNTLEKIAFEKAGIIKHKTPVIIGDVNANCLAVFQKKALEEQATLYFYADFKQVKTYFPSATYLAHNESLVRKAVHLLNQTGFDINEQQIEAGLKKVAQNTGFKGRFQILSEKPLIVVDAAHNEDGIKQVLQMLQNYQHRRLLVIYGASNDKDVNSILSLFPLQTHFFLTPFSNQRSLNKEELKALSKKSTFKTKIFAKIEDAFLEAKTIQNEEDILLITGSFFLLSDFFSFFSKKDLLK